MTNLLEIILARAANGEMTAFTAEALGNLKSKIADHPFPQGYLDRVREIESAWRVSAWAPPVN